MDIHERVTARILEQLEKGVIPWRKTWHGSLPINYVSRKAYRGVNLLLLPFGGEWLTFKQAKDAGGCVKKGEKASMIVFYKMMEKEDENGKKNNVPLFTILERVPYRSMRRNRKQVRAGQHRGRRCSYRHCGQYDRRLR